jgi:hypothetical protein
VVKSWFSILVLLVAGGAGCQEDPQTHMADLCAAHEAGWCGVGKYCEISKDNPKASRCWAVLADHSLCGLERWAGECTGSRGAGLDSGAGGSGASDAAAAADVAAAGGSASGGAGGGSASGGAGGGDAAAPSADMAPPLPATDAGSPDMMVAMPAPDAAPACTNVCTMDAKKCMGGDVQTCVLLPTGCTGWSAPAMCPAPQTCPDSKTKCECPTGANSCAKEGDQKCGPGMGVQTCAKSGACLAWATEKICDVGACVASSATKAACPACPKAASAGNLVPNAGFDKNLGGWTGDLGGEDASTCALSKSLLLVGTPGDDGSILQGAGLSPCFSLPGGKKFNFGAAMRRAAGSKVTCYPLVWSDSAACASNVGGAQRLDSVDDSLGGLNQWNRATVEIPAQPADGWARVNCLADGKGFVDEVFVSPSPGGSF